MRAQFALSPRAVPLEVASRSPLKRPAEIAWSESDRIRGRRERRRRQAGGRSARWLCIRRTGERHHSD